MNLRRKRRRNEIIFWSMLLGVPLAYVLWFVLSFATSWAELG